MTTEVDYFSWLCSKVSTSEEQNLYSSLFIDLFAFPYTVIPGFTVDEIRTRKTAELHDEFIMETGILSSSRSFVSCLEVLISLAESVESRLMRDSTYGNRTAEWFWRMVENLGLRTFTNDHYDRYFVLQTLENFVERRYSKDGHGSIAYTTRHAADFRKLDIWQQFNIYISEQYISKENPNERSNF